MLRKIKIFSCIEIWEYMQNLMPFSMVLFYLTRRNRRHKYLSYSPNDDEENEDKENEDEENDDKENEDEEMMMRR